MLMQHHIQQESHRKKYWIDADLIYPSHHIHQTLEPSDFQFFLFSIKCSEWQKILSRKSGENVCWKLELKTNWILLERNKTKQTPK